VNKRLFILAGEKSGDLHGAHFIQALRQMTGTVSIFAVAGPLMRAQGVQVILPMEEFELMGFTAIAMALPKIFKQLKIVTEAIFEHKIESVLLIDYPGFNLRLAKKLRKRGYKGQIIQYISPTFWAWGASRKQTMIDTLDRLLTIYPFEANHFLGTPLKATYVGHPVFDAVASHKMDPKWAKKCGIDETIPIISIFPGSRDVEIRRNLPLQLEALSYFKGENVQIAVSLSDEKIALPPDVKRVPRQYTYELMQASRASLAKSGTVTLELALHNCPTVVSYEMSPLNRFIAKYFLKLDLPFYSTANIVLGERVFPEFIEKKTTPKGLYEALLPLYHETDERKTCLKKILKLSCLYSALSTSEQVAIILKQEHL
jgi:lipid-A-disaccharide synthase